MGSLIEDTSLVNIGIYDFKESMQLLSCVSELLNFEYALPLNKTNDLILNLTPENVTQHSRIVTTTRKGSSTPTKMSKIIGRKIH